MRWLIMIAIADLWVGLTNRNSTFYKTLFNMIAFIATFITNLFVQSPFNNEKSCVTVGNFGTENDRRFIIIPKKLA